MGKLWEKYKIVVLPHFNSCMLSHFSHYIAVYIPCHSHAICHTYAFSYFTIGNTFCIQNIVLFNKFSMFLSFFSAEIQTYQLLDLTCDYMKAIFLD